MQKPHRLSALAERYGLAPRSVQQLECFLDSLVSDPHAPTTLRELDKAIDDHLADSLVALGLPELRGAGRAVDIGTGAGLPGVPLAIARPAMQVVLLESSARKVDFVARTIEACQLGNAVAISARVEAWPDGIGAFDIATARALAPLAVVAEYAAPLLRLGGTLVAWRGQRDREAEEAAARAAEALGLEPHPPIQVWPYEGAAHRHLHLMSKVRETPSRFPRRPGMARKRPLGTRRQPV